MEYSFLRFGDLKKRIVLSEKKPPLHTTVDFNNTVPFKPARRLVWVRWRVRDWLLRPLQDAALLQCYFRVTFCAYIKPKSIV